MVEERRLWPVLQIAPVVRSLPSDAETEVRSQEPENIQMRAAAGAAE